MFSIPPAFVSALFSVSLFVAGFAIVLFTLLSAVRAIVLPRSEHVTLNTLVFGALQWLFYLISLRAATYAARDRVMALIGPVGLLALPIVWLSMLSVGYTLMYYAAGVRPWLRAYDISGSALLTLGPPLERVGLPVRMMVFSEAALGLLLVALLITYLPTIYNSFTRRESIVAQLELRAGLPVTASGLVIWLYQNDSLGYSATVGLDDWRQWEEWFMDIEESHTSLPVLSVFRSREAGRSWVITATTILDAAALISTCIEAPRDPHRDLCLKAGVITVNRVARFFRATTTLDKLEAHPAANFSRADFGAAYQRLKKHDVPLNLPEDAAWTAFSDLRVRYQEAVIRLAHLVMAPVT